ncbi:MAG: hypothetical protein K2W94_05705 [Alphaproteobacteria bacterium]|nr:hypothetical protein [Alphaproteobacteria bacterium]
MRSILFVFKLSIFIFGFSILAISMEDGLIDPNDPSFSQNNPLRLSSTPYLEEDDDFMISPHLSDKIETPIAYIGEGNSPVSDSDEWKELTARLKAAQEEPHFEIGKRKNSSKFVKPKKRKNLLSPDEEDLSELNQEQRGLYNQIQFKAEINALPQKTLPCYQWIFLMHQGKMNMQNLVAKTGYTEGTLNAYAGHLRREGILPPSSRRKNGDTEPSEEPMLVEDTIVPELLPQSSSQSGSQSSSSLVISLAGLTKKKQRNPIARKPRTAITIPAPTQEDLAGLNEEQLGIYNQVKFKMDTGELTLGTLCRNQWFVLAHLKGMSDEDLNEKLCLADKTFGDYKSRLKNVGFLKEFPDS